MKLLILGATGKVGRLIVEQALAQGHTVVAFVRDPSKLAITNPHLSFAVGDAREAAQIVAAMHGCDAIISALGHNSAAKTDVLTAATKAVLGNITPQQRFISLTGYGVPDAHDPKFTLGGRFLSEIIKRIPGEMFLDGLRHAQLLRLSSANWVLVRAPRMSGGPLTHGYRTGYFPVNLFTAVTRADVADFMLENLATDEWLRQAPLIASR
jgi:hypothetical protein